MHLSTEIIIIRLVDGEEVGLAVVVVVVNTKKEEASLEETVKVDVTERKKSN